MARRKKGVKRAARDTQSFTFKFALRWIEPDGRARPQSPPPPEAAAQLVEFGRHYNDWIEIARDSRTAYREARSALVPEWADAEARLAEATAALDAVNTEVGAHKAFTRSRAIPPELRGRLEAARTARTEARRAFAAAKEHATASAALAAKSAEIGTEKNRREKQIRAATPLYWGSYLRAEEAADVAARKARIMPEFRRWYTGLPIPRSGGELAGVIPEGSIGVSAPSANPLTVETLYACTDTRLRLERGGKWRRGRIRIGSDGRAPVWAEFVARVHRELPAIGRVTSAWIKRERVGSHYDHWLCIAVEQAPPVAHGRPGVVGVDLNMRAVKDGIRVAVTYDGATFREWILPQSIADKAYHAHEIQSTRDTQFNAAKARLAAYLGTLEVTPEWLAESAKWLPQWKDHGKLARLVIEWRVRRFAGDEEILSDLEGWRKHDRHLLEYATHEGEKARRQRLDLYRGWAKEWADGAGTIVLPDYDWSELAALPWPGDDDDIPAAVRKRRHNVVAPSDLTDAVKHACRSRGVAAAKAMPVVACVQCGGHVEEQKEAGRVSCSTCRWWGSRDEAQARSLWAACERRGGDDGAGGARRTEGGDKTAESVSGMSDGGGVTDDSTAAPEGGAVSA